MLLFLSVLGRRLRAAAVRLAAAARTAAAISRRWGVPAGLLMALLWLGYSTGLWHDIAERARLAVRDIDRKVSHALGWPLPGTPDLTRLDERLAAKGLTRGAPVFMRIFKRDFELELWMKKGDRFVLFASYPICTWSGRLGPKLREGDRQAPEGFYAVSRGQLNPNSRWHRSFNLGYPNLFDRAHGRTGSYLMVHGGCASIGCYAMTNPVISEIWALVTAAFDGGQRRFAVHAFPFRLTGWRLHLYEDSRWSPFWRDLQRGYDLFEASRVPPRISVCNGRYAAEPGPPDSDGSQPLDDRCPELVSIRPLNVPDGD